MASQTLRDIQDKMSKTTEGLKMGLATIRTGRATPAIIEHVKIDYAGTLMPIHQLAGISVVEARLLVIQPWDKNSIHSIEKAILASDLGLTPISDGNVIRLNIPLLSEERRQELIKSVQRRVEERKIAIRNLRREALEEFKVSEKNKEISEDQHKQSLAQLQKLTDAFTTSVEQIGREKEAELRQV
ncbi:MAG: ribosome recycling factor [Dehalococcoidales bacterium]|jgi:ribosome recycling factor|nr:ribosome recycling factor [Dehalococcoidales bacterium]MDP7110166.1 ribosome recycling factor [Dehalococcoidales bacterium]MDP7309674.1 ribosome recycling factor [Dehalococcoidales bacterium]MDP7409393.1 ribosome recycling factor [Dehalococcoidales bacterium]MDP7675728.1 ribosome recycling factor [Dehalococcoidales bacterium]